MSLNYCCAPCRQSIRFEFLAALLVLATALFCASANSLIEPAIVGLAIGNALSFGPTVTVRIRFTGSLMCGDGFSLIHTVCRLLARHSAPQNCRVFSLRLATFWRALSPSKRSMRCLKFHLRSIGPSLAVVSHPLIRALIPCQMHPLLRRRDPRAVLLRANVSTHMQAGILNAGSSFQLTGPGRVPSSSTTSLAAMCVKLNRRCETCRSLFVQKVQWASLGGGLWVAIRMACDMG
jgi:hypothetical protein